MFLANGLPYLSTMMLRCLKSQIRNRALIRRRADRLMAAHGEEAWTVARAQAFAALGRPERSDLAWHVVARIERRMKIDWQPDTATRYLEGLSERRARTKA